MTRLIINPGTGAVPNATEEAAVANMTALLKDAGADSVPFERTSEADYGEGRFAFTIDNEDFSMEIQMPGLPLERVRYTGAADQNIWDYPRLYVNGDSWVWKYAVNSVRRVFTGEED